MNSGRSTNRHRWKASLLCLASAVLGGAGVFVAHPASSSSVVTFVIWGSVAVLLGAMGWWSAGAETPTAEELAEYTRGLEAAVRDRTSELEAANRELQRLATTDGLTGLMNHRAFQEVLAFELLRARRHPRSLALCMIDIDHFKDFNDALGHPAGDEVLRTVGRLLNENLRATDFVARYGGEEFAVVLLDSTAADGLQTAAKLCELFRSTTFAGDETLGAGLTVSVGVAAYPEHALGQSELIEKADIALYEAKRRGRDQAVGYEQNIPRRTTSDDLLALKQSV